ncbi:hypothetical protein HPB51_004330 [Rhipicephalus microplus]|uniref:Amino acid transporter n=1 Tax=Rhipicephalus microplus TaxID=6941 RepID=A0A9J6EKT5_RHIMP|nr:hypothetical protein HPB51_004330 [Rhipicephalus microplus]
MVSSMAHKCRRSQQQQQTVSLLATVVGLLIGVLVVPRTARRPLAVPGELLLRVSGVATLPLLACRLLLLPPTGRLLAAAFGMQLSASVAALLLAGWAPPSPTTVGPAEPLDWFRNAVPDNLLQTFVSEEGQRGRNTTPETRAQPGNLLGVATASALLGCALARQRGNRALRALLADAGEALTRLLNALLAWACPIGALSLALRAADEETTWWRGTYPAATGVALHAVLVAAMVSAAASRHDLQRLLAALSWPLCVAAVAGSSWHALPAALCALQQQREEPVTAALVVVRCGSALCNMLLLTPTVLQDRGLTQGLLLAAANSLFTVGRGDGPLLYLSGLPPLPGAV